MSKTMAFLANVGVAFVERFAQRLKGEGRKKAQDFTDTQVTHAVDAARQLENCKPMTQDLDKKLIKSICDKLKDSKELEARKAIENAQTDLARPWCIDSLKTAATIVCTCGPTVIREATFNLLGC